MYSFGDEELAAVARVIEGGTLFRYAPGACEAVSFERELATRFRLGHALLVSSGTAALICSLEALEIGPGDEVIVPAYGFIADPLAVLAVGAVPIVCEIDNSLTLDPHDLTCKISPRTRAIIAIHMNGFPCDMDKVSSIARKRSLYLVEDVCQAIGGSFQGQMLGTFADLAVLSFNQHKILTAGEGGAVLTARRELWERAFIGHDGSCGNSDVALTEALFAGLAFRASEITAAILRVQLRKLNAILISLRRSRDLTVDALSARCNLREAPCHDSAGACGTHIAYRFGSPEETERFCRIAGEEGFEAYRGNLYWHSYQEWTLLHERRGAHHPLRDPLRMSRQSYSFDDCPRTREILDHTALLACGTSFVSTSVTRLAERLAAVGL